MNETKFYCTYAKTKQKKTGHRNITLSTRTSIKMEYMELFFRRPCLSLLAALENQNKGRRDICP